MVLAAFALPVVSTPALAACTAPAGGVVNCADALPNPVDYNTNQGVNTLNVTPLSSSTTFVRLQGSGSAPSQGVSTTYSCSVPNGCTITTNPDNTQSCSAKLDNNNTPIGQCVNVPVAGGTGMAGPAVTVNVNAPLSGPVTIGSGRTTTAVSGISLGSNGGDGSDAYVFGNGGNGGNGANGGTVLVTFSGVVPNGNFGGIAAVSAGGNGGNGGDFAGIGGSAGAGGQAGAGGNATANFNAGSITVSGSGVNGVTAISRGGNGGQAGSGGGLVYVGGSGGGAGRAGAAEATASAGTTITTLGDFGNGIAALSFGGGGGDSSGGFGLFYSGTGSGNTGGAGGNATVRSAATITTYGQYANGIIAQSIGGGGGSAGTVIGAVALGGSGAGGGGGGTVLVQNAGAVTTYGIGANAILAQSIGGGGGSGSNSGGLFALGGNGSGTTTGGAVTVSNSGALTTSGERAAGILAQSIGGGGGNGGTAGGLFAFGGSGGAGADGGAVTVTNSGSIHTGYVSGNARYGNGAYGILAQSIGGGGGNGGGSVSVSPGLGLAFGGAGGMAGNGSTVKVLRDNAAAPYEIVTIGDNATAIVAQSIGGGGGNGGFAIAASANPFFSVALGVAGNGAAGGSGGQVLVETKGDLTTYGNNSSGILAQSLGGGGGNGGFAVGASLAEVAVSVGVGGSGAAGGAASSVTVSGIGDILTHGDNSYGILAQSIGGGGGNGGFSASGAAGLAGVSVGVGGSGGSGGAASSVQVTNRGNVETHGANAIAIAAQSIGGGGGNGGFAGVGALGAVGGAVGVGGSGASGGTASWVLVDQSGSVYTSGANANAILAQSIGGGGGNGGFAASGALTSTGGISVSVGGSGGGGQNAAAATIRTDGGGQFVQDIGYGTTWNTVTRGANASAIVAQSIGGGGGNGGWSVAGTLSSGASLGVAIGGTGAGGGNGGLATVKSGYERPYANNILTTGDLSSGIVAQSIGGGGGNGGFSGSLGAAFGPGAGAFSLGGAGGAGGTGSSAQVDSVGDIRTVGNFSNGILVQSIGGSGGNGGLSVAVAGSSTFGAAVSIGGSGAAGSHAGAAFLRSYGTIVTQGNSSNGLIAQSIGGGGGNGGVAGSGTLAGIAPSVSVGGRGAGGGNGSTVAVINGDSTIAGNIVTMGNGSSAIVAQSIGGGGGNGGGSIGVALGAVGIGVAVGGEAGAGGGAGSVMVTSVGNLATGYGATPERGTGNAFGILAQSIGGGGGNGGYAGAVSLGGTAAVGVAVGGSGGAGGSAGTVTVSSTGDISTVFDNSAGIMAQSIGGGGGNGGFSFAVSGSGAIGGIGGAAAVAVGGSGDNGGNAAKVSVASTGNIYTRGIGSSGIVAQSIGGGGGNGGFAVGAGGSVGLAGIGVSVGGFGAGGGAAGAVEVTSYGAGGKVLQAPGTVTLQTDGDLSNGILAQSLGGGGGNGGFSVGAGAALGGDGIGVSVGGFGAGGGDGAAVSVESYNTILTRGLQSNGIAAQSLGGGGGNGGFSVAAGAGAQIGGAVSVGGFAQSGGGDGGTVSVTSVGTIATLGDMSNGILAQSIGGGGGNGGWSASGNFAGGAAGIGASVGGFASAGGAGGDVSVASYGAGLDVVPSAAGWTITTAGVQSNGILAQSVGGGGGNGGWSVAGGIASGGVAINVAVGGFGGAGGAAGTVGVTSYNNIATSGAFSNAISAQSVGGGGGNGGFSVAGSGGNSFASGIAVGGWGGEASAGNAVTVTSYGALKTTGDNARGILAQSIGGGGGNGGFAVSGTFSASSAGFGANVGGFGAGGGNGGAVNVTSYGNGEKTAVPADTLSIFTSGNFSDGILAQSVGGGGGNGGFSVGAGLATAGGPITISVGGFGAGGGSAGAVSVVSYNNVRTQGNQSNAVAAQSLGGGGGNGGFAATLAAGSNFAASATVGGVVLDGGGDGGTVNVTSVGLLSTYGDRSNAILAQSVGGGGGNGGFAVAGAFTLGTAGVSASVGGKGGDGGAGGAVTVESNVGTTLGTTATIFTAGANSDGILAQSIGGGGGTGGFSGAIAGTIGAKASLALSVGGFGGAGSTAGKVTVKSVDNILTEGEGSNAIVAQSVGGGGGSGGFSLSGSLNIPDGNGLSLSASLGGFGGSGGDAGAVDVTSAGWIMTMGGNANGVVAQSIGGGGGNGGVSVAGTFNFASQNKVPSISAAVGGFGGAGGSGGDVEVTRTGDTVTLGDRSNAILAQSIGGGGGNGGVSIAGALGGKDTKQISASVGGFGGDGSSSGDVTVRNTGDISTGAFGTAQVRLAVVGDPQFETVTTVSGADSNGILAQSIGGGGGNGGFSFAGTVGLTGTEMSIGIAASVGGFGGSGGTAGDVSVTNDGTIVTRGDRSNGIAAQSIGGGGGNGGGAVTGLFAAGNPQAGGNAVSVAATVGGFGGEGNVSGAVFVEQSGSIVTYGGSSNGILAQSIGGGGGNGGNANSIALQLGSSCTQGLVSKVISSCQSPKAASIKVQADVGGFGGTGNDANTVTVINHGAVTTLGASSSGIVAQSIGGGGGTGGQASAGFNGLFPNAEYLDYGTTVVGLTVGATGLLKGAGVITVGGFGGASGDGKLVDVTNEGVIRTSGASSHGIFAQSVGGGGGVGGSSTSGLTGLVSVGGFGGGSGDGGAVKVTNVAGANIFTAGDHSNAIFAQSIGGGGGTGYIDGNDGQAALNTQAAATETVNGQIVTYPAQVAEDGSVPDQGNGSGGSASGLIALGGFGGQSGNGGLVTVHNSALLSTTGDFSAGIEAQSIGGGGGNGGGTGLSAIAVGGYASVLGATGNGGDVSVTNDAVSPDASTAAIHTLGVESYGIFAQSVGGSGGNGGGNSKAAIATVGGAGGNAGAGGHVQVSNSGIIATEGEGAIAVFAQSIGGSGGVGGGGSLAAVAVGGNQGSGGNGGEVNVTNSAVLQTLGDNAAGVFAQSVGGGGGAGRGTGSTFLDGDHVLVSVGGKGSGGGAGGVVTIDNSAGVLTKGFKSYGLQAQSVGGGGGDAGMAAGLFEIGGTEGSNGNGGAVTVTNRAGGGIETFGALSNAIVAQSIGGGGGSAGGLYDGDPATLAATIGGKDNGGGSGGKVEVDNAAWLVSHGANVDLIVAQSVGGGGGIGVMTGTLAAPAGALPSGPGVRLGGTSGAKGDGGEVVVENKQGGTLVAFGGNSTGILAQSVGGGGGVAAASIGFSSFQAQLGGQNGATGDGGDVSVTNSGAILAFGDNSVGLFAQSVGGGGGVVKPGNDVTGVQLSDGGTGDGGAVTVSSSGGIYVSGDNSIGLFAQSIGGGGGAVGLSDGSAAQASAFSLVPAADDSLGAFRFVGSAGGSGVGKAVTIDQSSDIVADGANSVAVGAQSVGPDGNGNITVNILSPNAWLTYIEGGSGRGAGVVLRDGRDNVVNNAGYLTSAPGINGYAVRATGGNDTLNNTAVMVGSVNLGAGRNALNNRSGALFNSGIEVYLGDGNLFRNDGLTSPGAFEKVMTTVVTGDFTQGAGGYYGLDLQLADNTADRIVVTGDAADTGTARVQGNVVVNVMSPGLAQSGAHRVNIVHADDEVADHTGLDLITAPSAVATYSLLYPKPQDIDLGYVIDFSPGGLTRNQHAVGNAINLIQANPISGPFTPIAAALFYQPTVEALGQVFNMLSGEGVAGAQQPSFVASDRFQSAMGQQLNAWLSSDLLQNPCAGTDRERIGKAACVPNPKADEPQWRAWASAFGGNGSLSGNAWEVGSADLSFHNAGAALGLEYRASRDLILGAVLGASNAGYSVDDRFTAGSFDAGHVGLYGGWRSDRFYVDGTLAFSLFDNTVNRFAAIPGVEMGWLGGVKIPDVPGFKELLHGSYDSWMAGGRLEAGYRFSGPGFDVTPFAALQVSALQMDGFTETQLGGLPSQIGLAYNSRSIASVPLFLGSQIDTRFSLGGALDVYAFARAAWVHEFDPERAIEASFIAAPGFNFLIQGASAAQDSARVDAGLQLMMNKTIALFGNFSADVSNAGNTLSGGGGLKISW